jgi:hypothetical protein
MSEVRVRLMGLPPEVREDEAVSQARIYQEVVRGLRISQLRGVPMRAEVCVPRHLIRYVADVLGPQLTRIGLATEVRTDEVEFTVRQVAGPVLPQLEEG